MNRLQKKCAIVSGGLHALLVGIFVFGSAFFNSGSKSEKVTILTAFDPSLVNALMTTGGNPNVATVPPPPAHPQQNRPQEAQPVKEPPRPRPREIVHNTPKPPVEKDTGDEIPKPRHKDVLTADELKLNRPRTTKVHKVHNQTSDSQSREYADAQREIRSLNTSLRVLKSDLSTRTTVELQPGPGGGGPVSASFRDILASTYDSAWSSPPDLSDDNAKVTISVTVARDGRVVNSRIVSSSHNAAMDRSIQNLLDTVNFIAPFPAGMNESERSFEIVLSLRAKH